MILGIELRRADINNRTGTKYLVYTKAKLWNGPLPKLGDRMVIGEKLYRITMIWSTNLQHMEAKNVIQTAR
jgi:hypothetical protein